jgi:hypothetical protein
MGIGTRVSELPRSRPRRLGARLLRPELRTTAANQGNLRSGQRLSLPPVAFEPDPSTRSTTELTSQRRRAWRRRRSSALHQSGQRQNRARATRTHTLRPGHALATPATPRLGRNRLACRRVGDRADRLRRRQPHRGARRRRRALALHRQPTQLAHRRTASTATGRRQLLPPRDLHQRRGHPHADQHVHPNPSWVGIGLAAVTAATMPIHAGTKRRIGNRRHAA